MEIDGYNKSYNKNYDNVIEEYSVFYNGEESEFRKKYKGFFESYNCVINSYIKTDDGLLVLFKAPENIQNELENIVNKETELSLLEKHPEEDMIRYGPRQPGDPEGKA